MIYTLNNMRMEGKGYYLDEFVSYLKNLDGYYIETIYFLSGYNKMEIHGNLFDPQKKGLGQCIITIYSENVIFLWKQGEKAAE